MEDFSFRPSFEVEKVPSNFFSSAMNYLDSLDHSKALKPDQIPNPLQVAHEFRRHRLSSFEAPVFYPYKDEEHFPEGHDHVKAENLAQDFPQFGHHPHTDFGFEFPISTKLQDCAVDYYRINRSRGPSFNWGPGRKNSEDLFAHGFDLLYRNFEQQNDKMFSQELNDAKLHPTFLDAPLIPQALTGNFNSLAENNYHNHLQMHYDNGLPKELVANVAGNIQQSQAQNAHEAQQQPEVETKGKKKRKTNNRQEPEAQEEAEAPVKKVKTENKKNAKTAEPALKSSKSMVEKPAAKKNSETKTPKGKKAVETFVKAEIDDHEKEEKSTEASSINVSPIPKKEDLPNLFKSKSSIVGTFGHFKKPETAQELLGGLSLPAEVEEYINNSKIFNQIKAPVIKKIGTLTLEERRVKIEKYLEKRKRRSWNKRVNYDCRKKVADNRLRIKGRFVTKDQAFGMLEACGIFPDPEKITNNEIKELLTERFGSILKKKDLFGEAGAQPKQGKGAKVVKAENNKEFNFGEMGGEQESSFGSQEDSMSETYLRD